MSAPLVILGIYLFVSLATFIVYGLDKRAAMRGRRRVSESTLHILALAGGFPGAWLGQRQFRHKRRKVGFLAGFWLIVLAHGVGWALWFWRPWVGGD